MKKQSSRRPLNTIKQPAPRVLSSFQNSLDRSISNYKKSLSDMKDFVEWADEQLGLRDQKIKALIEAGEGLIYAPPLDKDWEDALAEWEHAKSLGDVN